MSTKKHTAGKLRIGGDPKTENLVADVRGVRVFGDYGAIPCRADAERLVATWNACAGMADPQAEIARLRECEAALEGLLELNDGNGGDAREQISKIKAARAALAKK